MNPRSVQAGLEELRRSFAPILHDSAAMVLEEAHAGLYPFIRGKRRRGDSPWGYSISPAAPLQFRPTIVDELGYEVWVDVYCVVKWLREGAAPIEQDIKLRVWSKKQRFLHDFERRAFDEAGDVDKLEPSIREVIERMANPDSLSGRVIYRCHFDRADQNPKQAGPEYHLQFGGKPEADELGWLPEIISLPRIVHPPFDLILICELIAANFYLKEYEEIRRETTWKSILHQSQMNMLVGYYQGCVEALEAFDRKENDSLLMSHLWNR